MEDITKYIYTSADSFEVRVKEIKNVISVSDEKTNISYKFLYLAFRDREPTLDEFVGYIYDKIIYFCIPRERIERAFEKFKETNDMHFINELTEDAKNSFVSAKSKAGAMLGEPGELILFCILEYMLQAPQIACKMSLKTSSQMPVHGTDALHIKYDTNDNKLILFWGESKLYKCLSNSFDSICESIFSFVKDRNQRKTEINIIRNYINIPDKKVAEEIIKYFDPYNEEYNNTKDVFACFAGFDSHLYDSLNTIEDDKVIKYFEERYIARAEKAYKLFGEKINKNGINDFKYTLLLLPFKSIEEFRAKFFRRMGIEYLPLEEEDAENE